MTVINHGTLTLSLFTEKTEIIFSTLWSWAYLIHTALKTENRKHLVKKKTKKKPVIYLLHDSSSNRDGCSLFCWMSFCLSTQNCRHKLWIAQSRHHSRGLMCMAFISALNPECFAIFSILALLLNSKYRHHSGMKSPVLTMGCALIKINKLRTSQIPTGNNDQISKTARMSGLFRLWITVTLRNHDLPWANICGREQVAHCVLYSSRDVSEVAHDHRELACRWELAN